MIAINTIRREPHYRRAAFDAGLERLGYKLVTSGPPRSREDLLLMWNLHGGNETLAAEWERLGGTVLVCENGYLGRDELGRQLYAIAAHGHNGSGWFPVGTDGRFEALGIDLAPWRPEGGHMLVAGQRGIGSRSMASPSGWDDRTVARLRDIKVQNVKLRRHPGRTTPETTLEQDLDGASLCVIWSSASGVKALTMGIPVVYCAPHWICEGAASRGLGTISAPVRDDALRRLAMHRMAYGQWRVEEIEAGAPFRWILEHPHFGSLKW
ncbi:MAG TPA: hypothetical protein VNU48_12985 [Burkholderiaceae bacterium]|nr:hypothetical protein [Burkholderiaceae bacterium]